MSYFPGLDFSKEEETNVKCVSVRLIRRSSYQQWRCRPAVTLGVEVLINLTPAWALSSSSTFQRPLRSTPRVTGFSITWTPMPFQHYGLRHPSAPLPTGNSTSGQHLSRECYRLSDTGDSSPSSPSLRATFYRPHANVSLSVRAKHTVWLITKHWWEKLGELENNLSL